MVNTTKTSFIIPVYNRPKELKSAIGSCLAQTSDNWEAVVVDDHSDQADIKELINAFNDNRIRYIKQDRGKKGEAAARETAIRNANSDIFITLDSDDINHPHRASRCQQFLEVDAPRLIYTRVRFFSSENLSGHNKSIFQPFNPVLYEMINFITNPGTAFNRAAYVAAGSFYNKSLKLATDYDQFIRMSRAGVNIIGLDEVHVSYRKHDGAVTSGANHALHQSIMQVRIQNNIQPFSIESIQMYALPELSTNILKNDKQRSLWQDDRWIGK